MTKIKVTPELAKEWLKSNHKNRNVSEKRVIAYAKEMKRGAWREDTYEFIKMTKNGRVLDGQHRLHAVIMAGVPISFHVVSDVPEDVHSVLDTGKSRTASDVFSIEGIPNATNTTAIMQKYFLLSSKKSIAGASMITKKSNSQLLSIYRENPEFWLMVHRKSISWYEAFGRVLPASHIGALYAYFHKECNPDLAAEFMDQFCTGQDITNNAIALLRQKLIADRISMKKMGVNVRLALVIKTFNYFVSGKTPKILKFAKDKENFPSVKKMFP